MKNIFYLLAVILCSQVHSQSQNLDSKIVSAIVYNSGAQVTSEKKINLNQGTHTLVFENLSPNIDESSIILEGLEHMSLNSISFETDFLNEMESSKALDDFKNRLKKLEKEKVYTQNKITSLEKSIVLLEKNQELKAKESELNVEKIKAYKDYYASQIESLSNSIYDQSILVEDFKEKIQKLQNEIRKIESDNRVNRGKITLQLDVEKAVNPTLSLNYFIYDAGWYASYDLKSMGINKDIQLNYNAKIYQSSGQDWDDIDLKLSTANPTSDKTKPEIEPYYLDFNRKLQTSVTKLSRNYVYNPSVKSIKGRVLDEQGRPLPGVNVMIGSRGTQTDFDGNYRLEVNGVQEIQFSYLGFNSEVLPIYSNIINVTLTENSTSLEEVVVLAYDSAKRSEASSQVREVAEIVEQQQSVEFVIPKKVSLTSGSDSKQIQLNQHQLKTKYEYYAAPELSNSVFLIAEINDWKDLNLISGKANLYFENSFLGTTNLNTSSMEDELIVSLGADENIIMERTLPNKKTSKSFFGSNTIIEKAYEIEIKNTKGLPISILVQERLPISRNEAIKVENIEYSGADYDEKKGFLNWEFDLNSGENKTLEYNYSVKYPKDQKLFLRP